MVIVGKPPIFSKVNIIPSIKGEGQPMLIVNGKLVTWGQPNRMLEDHAIVIRDGRIAHIAPQKQVLEDYSEEEVLDAKGQFVMPGNICAHTHFYGAYSRGLGIPATPAEDFPEILEKLWWPLDESLSMDDVKYSTLVCLVDAIRHGTTTLVDHHASPNAITGSLDAIADAVDQAGVRAALAYEVTDRGGEARAQAGIEENQRFIERIRSGDDAGGRLAATFGLHASLTLSDETLEKCRRAAPGGTGFHVHVAEHPADEYDSLQKSGERVVDRLHRHGILGPETIAVHAVHIDVKEIMILAETATWVTHQPRSNMNNAVGIAPVEAMLRAGVKVCLGNDGFSNTMWDEWKTTYLVHKLWNHDPRRMPGEVVAQMAIYNNAALASQLFKHQIGSITPGAAADIIFVDYHPFTPISPGNLPWHILFGFNESMVTMTMVAGKVLMHNRQLLTLDEEKIASEAREKLAPLAWDRFTLHFKEA
jgi:putative selenium metabolism protein SsnA